MIRKYILIIICIAVGFCESKKLPSYIKRCNYTTNGEELGECILNVFQTHKEKFILGIPELHIPSLDPFIVDEIDFRTGENTAINLQSHFTNVTIEGMRNLNLIKINIDIPNEMCSISLHFPLLRIRSDYDLNGRIMVMRLNSTGHANGNFTNIYTTNYFKGKFVTRNNKQFIDWVDKKLDLTVESGSLHFDDLFPGNKELSTTTNNIINENYEEILKELKPFIEETILTITFTMLQSVFQTFSIDELFIK